MIFTITAVSSFRDLATIHDRKCLGYFPTIAEAQSRLEYNRELTECGRFDWIVIESYEPGIPAIASDHRYWYRHYEALGWMEVEEPDWAKGFVNWAIG